MDRGDTEWGMANDDSPPLYLQIATQMAELIRNGTLARSARMPSVRELARQRGVAQSTVVQAYHWLEDARLIAARPRSGYFVAPRPAALPEPSVSRSLRRPRDVSVDWLGQRILGTAHSADVVSFSSGTPGPDLLDVDRVRRAVTRSAQRHRQLLCTYPSSSGHEDARRAIARYAVGLGCSLDPGRILVTGGCMDSISLCLRTVTQPGDVVALESPTHFSFLEVLQGLHLKALEIPTHPRHGISLDALQLALETQPVKALLVVPTLSNPLGACMPQAERRRLAQMAARHGLAVIEDAVYSDLAEQDEHRRAIKSYDTTGHVMLCDSFSKTLAPGLRLGWVEAGRWTEPLRRIKDLQARGRGAPGDRVVLSARHTGQRSPWRLAVLAGIAPRRGHRAVAPGLFVRAHSGAARHHLWHWRAFSQLSAHWRGRRLDAPPRQRPAPCGRTGVCDGGGARTAGGMNGYTNFVLHEVRVNFPP